MYRNTVIIYRGDRLNLQSGRSFFHAADSAFYGKYVRKAVIFLSGSGNEIEIIGERCMGHFAGTSLCVLWHTI